MTVEAPPAGLELATEIINLTLQRAELAQQTLGRTMEWAERDRPEDEASDQIGDYQTVHHEQRPTMFHGSGDELGLPNPGVTNAYLRHYLEAALASQPHFGAGGLVGGWKGAFRQVVRAEEQVEFNTAVLHALHQLDHRTRVQERTIVGLEAQVVDLRRALAARSTRPEAAPASATSSATSTGEGGR